MALNIRNLSIIAYANGFQSWHYKSLDSLETITAADYFAEARDMMDGGDCIIINAADANAQRFVRRGGDSIFLVRGE